MLRLKSLLAGGMVATLAASSAFAGRGTDGAVKILNWQAPSMMNSYLAQGDKETIPASLVLEPLAGYDENGELFPRLAAEIPTVENGGVAKDLKSITWKLRPGLKWSDGSPVTSKDVVFTANYCMDPKVGCSTARFQGVDKVEALDDLTVKVTFKEPTGVPYTLFVGKASPIIQANQFADCLGAKAQTCTEANFYPVGTGPFVVTSFKPNDAIQLKANPNYRDPNKPAFAEVDIKGGGDALGAARAVLQTGEYDYAMNLQLAPDVLSEMEKGDKGKVAVAFGAQVEFLFMNLTDPSPSLPPEERSTAKHPHPILSDVRVRKALSMALDRARLSEIGYGSMGKPTCDFVPAPPTFAAGSTGCLEQDIPDAKRLLDEAGWKQGPDGIREKDGEKLNLTFVTTTNAVRNQFQAIIKQWWHEIGVEVELKSVDASVFFGSDPSNPETYTNFYADAQMWADYFDGTDPGAYVEAYTCSRVPQPGSPGTNTPRYCDTNYDALVTELGKTADIQKRGEIVKKLDTILTDSYAIMPLVWRGVVSAISNTLGGTIPNAWDSELGNAQDWYRKK
ncbi:MAG: peptide ABC transporter substrate-binding protein [Mesorhizobium sp.]|uniref:peptide ABC transporter substrate-binding protein n=3 Tax=Mesorhizobium TaxID=68287 RepID=UPI000FCAC163|nr:MULTISPECIES: peptide ABC transporter substrate-binding protein [unclassified Mesorhizobium]TGV09344.1 peptide ABC transporter substrate-binding protein [Mesorhizobium sp. M8A.F.Ca.ET.173.01.1.1]RVD62277.1 peptide ABC transporter substrate-binding protein [Mesorhizobium sp. M7A.F.Ca.ET.027.03.2.1]RWC86936.1 MAG: peptide ABC transporter substrate-binding protein [Mesorhizobium sp.]RWE77916.1 MAG: peptide ABC transporter substrate-binding protein [Mesorhizobium sp.]RWP36773.1 MAG: peptide ABC